MQLSTLLSVILACIVAAAAIPLQLTDEHDGPTTFRPELERALQDANQQIPRMLTTIAAAKRRDAAALERVRMAFGPKPRLENIEENIRTLETGMMRVLKNDIPEGDYGRTHVGPRSDRNQPLRVNWTRFGTKFYAKDTSHEQRASVVVHEAAHALFAADDDYADIPGDTRMLYLGVKLTDNEARYRVIRGGYATDKAVANSPGHLINEDDLAPEFKYVRGKAYNMDRNADSYSLFGALCEQPETSRPWISLKTAQPGGSGSSRPGGSGTGRPSQPESSARPVRPGRSSRVTQPGSSAQPVIPTASGRPVRPARTGVWPTIVRAVKNAFKRPRPQN